MKRHFFLFSIAMYFLIFSCKSLPVIESGKSGLKPDISPFPGNKYQLTHSIKADLPNGDTLLLIGLTVVNPDERSIHAVMMTVEGLVLFDVSYQNNSIIINRGMPGMSADDSANFIHGLLNDLKLIYFMPECAIFESGIISGKYINRYKCDNGITIDIIKEENGAVIINKYDSGNSLLRIVNIFSLNKDNVSEKLELIAPGIFGYSLYMELINVEKL
jgi:hypothetical protein